MKRTPQWIIGWREWLAIPDLDVPAIKAKIDTGAATSSLHAFDLERYRRSGVDYVYFNIHPLQRSHDSVRSVEAEVLDERRVRSSNGQVEERPVIRMKVKLLTRIWKIDVTLSNRDEMGFRMLLGRRALRGRFLVDPGRSFLAGTPHKARRSRR